MEKPLSEQIQELIDLLQRVAEQAEDVTEAVRAQLASFGPEFAVIDEDLGQVIRQLQRLKALVERVEHDNADNHGQDGTPAA